jgi:hypothetical protein|tara:strand:- start:2798 stop:3349 length:552 start_codon:yes stop_codon:yes gene_type:complete
MANGHSAEAIAATAPTDDDRREWENYMDEDWPAVRKQQRMNELNVGKKPMTRKEFLTALTKEHNLSIEDDIFSKKGLWAIIKLSGIEKIQNNLNIRVTFDHIVTERDFAVIKATAHGAKEAVQSYGSCLHGSKTSKPPGNHHGSYMVEMAEKRAKARAVLKLCGAYKYGIYSEDESDDFKQDK